MKSKSLGTFIYLYFLPAVLFAQSQYLNKDWEKREGVVSPINPYIEQFISPQSSVDSYGNLYIASHENNTSGNSDIIIVKYDRNGNQVWKRYFDNSGKNDFASSIGIDNNGNILVCGSTHLSGQNYDYVILKYASDGTDLWVNFFNGPADDLDIPISICADPAGNVYVTGASNGGATMLDYCTLKYSGSGTFLWQHRYNFSDYYDIPVSLVADGGGNIIITGGSGTTFTDWDFATIKLSSGGVLLNSNRISNNAGMDKPNAMLKDINGNIYVVGSTFNQVNNSIDQMIVKYNAQLNQQWIRKFDGYGEDDAAMAIDADYSGNVFVGGVTHHPGEDKNFTLLKYNSNGNLLWNVEYGNNEFLGDDVVKRIKVDVSGNSYLIGDVRKSGFSSTVVVCYDTQGNKL